jgi:hypothetical protein
MGEGHWVEVRVAGDAGKWAKAVRHLRMELAAEGLPTQDVVERVGPEVVVSVALAGGGAVVPTVVGVLRDWIKRRKSPERVVVTLDGESMDLERATFDERTDVLETFLSKHQQR